MPGSHGSGPGSAASRASSAAGPSKRCAASVTASAYRPLPRESGCGIAGASDFGGRGDRGAVAGDDPVEDVDGGELLVDAGQELLGIGVDWPARRWRWFSARPRVSIV